jgi:polyisoprenoid-binding protein YceI
MKKAVITMILVFAVSVVIHAQVAYNTSSAKIEITGTSTLHDWSMASEKAYCNASFKFDGANLINLSSLSFVISVQSLKSDHNGMDKNAYKALRAEKYPLISFNSSYANIHSNSPNSYVISANGKLTISGVTKDVWLVGVTRVNPDDMSISTTGFFKI